MDPMEMTCKEYVNVLASSSPTPGGGGASALAGAVGTALGSMVASLTIGKKKYAGVEEEMKELQQRANDVRDELLALSKEDADVFAPLAAAYGMPTGTPEEKAEKEKVMEQCLLTASQVPLRIMEACGKALDLMKEFAAKGSVMAVSDAGVGAALCRGAMQGASLNIYINTKSMKDRGQAAALEEKADALREKYTRLADEIFDGVEKKLRP